MLAYSMALTSDISTKQYNTFPVRFTNKTKQKEFSFEVAFVLE